MTPRTDATTRDVTFPRHSSLHEDLRKSVAAYFERDGRSSGADWRMWLKAAVVLGWLVVAYVALVFWATSAWLVVPLAIAVGLAVAAVGFNIQHDGGHDACSRKRTVNRLAALCMDLVGASSYVWRFKHTIIHHHYTNVVGVDEDLEAGGLIRLSPGQPLRFWHRFQHLYAWVLYGFLVPKWNFVDDFMNVARGRVGSQPIPRPGFVDLAVLILGKAWFFGWVFAIPLLLGHDPLTVVLLYVLASLVCGITLSVVFQLAHCVEEAELHTVPSVPHKMERPFAEHQLSSTVDFCPRNPVVSWLMGGLNFQVEHHLFPRVCHVHYPAIEPIVREVCARHGVAHRSHPTLSGAVRSHFRFLRKMGRAA